jgi:hypothetical protein
MRKNFVVFVVEVLAGGFYVSITRGLAPIFFIIYGLELAEVLKLNLIAYLIALAVSWIFYTFRSVVVGRGFKHKLLFFHTLERLMWGSTPFVALYKPQLLYPIYSLAMALTVPVSIMLNIAMMSSFDTATLKRVYAYRNAFGSISTAIGQTLSMIVIAAIEGIYKYVLLYVVAMSIGLISSAILVYASIKTPEVREEVSVGIEAVKSSTVFTFLTFLTAAGAVLGISWGPYIVKELKAEEYLAVALGFAMTLTNTGAAVFWSGKSYGLYRHALTILPLIPVAITSIKLPYLHIAIAVAYSFANVAANLLASFIFAEIAKRFSIYRASTMLSTAFVLAQVVGLGAAYAASTYGTQALFLTSTVLAGISIAIAFLAIPEIALVAPELSMAYAAHIHGVSLALYNFTISTVRSYAVISVKALALALALIALYTVFRLLYYVIHLLVGTIP